MTVIVFGVASVAFYGLAAVYVGNSSVQEAQGGTIGALSTFTQLITILIIKFRNKRNAKLCQRHSILASSCLGLLFCLSVSSLIISIQREEYDESIDNVLVLHILIPLLVDFRIHAAILSFSMISDFIEHHYVEGLECHDLRTEPTESDISCNCTCAMPGCGKKIYPAPEYHMTCSKDDCYNMFCSECCDVVICQTGTCTCAFEETASDSNGSN